MSEAPLREPRLGRDRAVSEPESAVEQIWRYPIMGLQGEKLSSARVATGGIQGDRDYVVRDRATTKVLDPKTLEYAWGVTGALPSMLDVGASLVEGPNGERLLVLSEGDASKPAASPKEAGRSLSMLLGHDVDIELYPRVVEARIKSGRALHLLTDSSLLAIRDYYPRADFDPRRFRANVLLKTGGNAGFIEEKWVGQVLRLGDELRVKVGKPNIRCEITTMRQGALPEDPAILETINSHNAKKLGVLCTVLTEGTLRVGDRVAFE